MTVDPGSTQTADWLHGSYFKNIHTSCSVFILRWDNTNAGRYGEAVLPFIYIFQQYLFLSSEIPPYSSTGQTLRASYSNEFMLKYWK